MGNVVDEALARSHGNRVLAAMEVAQGLVADDPVSHRAPYSVENAAIAASEAFGLDAVEGLMLHRLLTRWSGEA